MIFLLFALACSDKEPADSSPAPPLPEREILVAPYIQSLTDTDAWILWITDESDESWVEWGPTEALGQIAAAETDAEGLGLVHAAHLEGLPAGEDVYYRAHTDGSASETHRFRAAPAPGADGAFLMVAMSDMQRDDNNPDQFREIVQDGVIPWVESTYDAAMAQGLGPVLVAGDLVDNGWDYTEWWSDFFGPAAPLLARAPLYPVLGNHEAGTPLYLRYFRLHETGTPGFEEYWWVADYGNVRLIGLDSNLTSQFETQLGWLDGVLEGACSDEHIDFAFAELHHPYKSELWTPGELDFTGEVIARMEAFTEACGKPSVHLFGHTHGYSRGQSRDHRHLWVNVASAGGALDRWGSYDNADYAEFTVSQDEWGFAVLEVTSGDDPSFTLTRVSQGHGEHPRDNEVRDSVTVRRYDSPPSTPTGSPAAVGAEGVTLSASAFSDPDGDLHGASHWQVAADCADFSAPAFEAWRQHENWYLGADTMAGASLTSVEAEGLAAGGWCWRVRYRDRGLSWSGWSQGVVFEVGGG